MNINKVFYYSSTNMNEVPGNSVDLIITSPPYFNIISTLKIMQKMAHKIYSIQPNMLKI
ncbi:hypothetical protein N403_08265 [Helicobacter pylori FD430]|nr:hypothetical protein N403_08265 [Helicobacter pylori FD430]